PLTQTYPLSLHDALPIFDEGTRLDPEIQFFELIERPGQAIEVQKRRPPVGVISDYLEVHAIGNREDQDQLTFDLFVDDHEFHAQDRKSTRLNSSHVKISY